MHASKKPRHADEIVVKGGEGREMCKLNPPALNADDELEQVWNGSGDKIVITLSGPHPKIRVRSPVTILDLTRGDEIVPTPVHFLAQIDSCEDSNDDQSFLKSESFKEHAQFAYQVACVHNCLYDIISEIENKNKIDCEDNSIWDDFLDFSIPDSDDSPLLSPVSLSPVPLDQELSPLSTSDSENFAKLHLALNVPVPKYNMLPGSFHRKIVSDVYGNIGVKLTRDELESRIQHRRTSFRAVDVDGHMFVGLFHDGVQSIETMFLRPPPFHVAQSWVSFFVLFIKHIADLMTNNPAVTSMTDFNLGNVIFNSVTYDYIVDDTLKVKELEAIGEKLHPPLIKKKGVNKEKYIQELKLHMSGARIAFSLCDKWCAGPYTEETVAYRMLYDPLSAVIVDTVRDARDTMLERWKEAIYTHISFYAPVTSEEKRLWKVEIKEKLDNARSLRDTYQQNLVRLTADPSASDDTLVASTTIRIIQNMNRITVIRPDEASKGQVAALGKLCVELTLSMFQRFTNRAWSMQKKHVAQALKLLKEKNFFELIVTMVQGELTASQLSSLMSLDEEGRWRGLKVREGSLPESNKTALLSKLSTKKRKRE